MVSKGGALGRDLLALIKKMVALERAADGVAAETQHGEEGRL
ncbi:hypothetical protein BQ8482_111622 [Mesorhizobium delmotii]|uniref:Uncharacterized protein n=1 Tax=Mesorhizobium delmotii TaxID=1631247 RepID=A0A2P9AEY8_9HYPH|nr:hypothetical protein BQ8482_111622 [Mesorhizobium delmotii]